MPARPSLPALPTAPALADVAREAARFGSSFRPDAGWERFVEATRPAADLSASAHRQALLRWLNAWGCRIRYPRPGEADRFDESIAAWWAAWHPVLPATGLAALADEQIDALGEGYAALAAAPVSAGPRGRRLGPTAAAKSLYALRPAAVMPWDEAIAVGMHGGRDGAAFARHLRTGRAWALALMAEAGVGEDALPAALGRPGLTVAKVLDEYCYLVHARGSG
ncbi:MAG: hypothetical protein ACJ74O_02585 [Frankiaceae bacterium]